MKTCLFVTLVSWLGVSALAQKPPQDVRPPEGLPPMLQEIGIHQRLGEQVPLDLDFRDSRGQPVRLGDFLGEKPVILALVYYRCPMLCNQVLNGLTRSLRTLPLEVGREFDVLAVSFDAREAPEASASSRRASMHLYSREGTDAGWHFLTGEQDSIDALTKAVGFAYKYDPQDDQFAHASGIMVLTPEGKLARYFYGIEYGGRDVRLALVEASDNRIGSAVDQLLLYCYRYDPTTGKYGLIVMNMMRIGGLVTLVGIAAMILLLKQRQPASSNHSRA